MTTAGPDPWAALHGRHIRVVTHELHEDVDGFPLVERVVEFDDIYVGRNPAPDDDEDDE